MTRGLAALVLCAALAQSAVAARLGADPVTLPPTAGGDNLWNLTRALALEARVDHAAVMVATFRRNPDAFAGANMFFMYRGAVIVVPALEDIRAEDRVAAESAVRVHERSWRAGRNEAPALPALRATPAPPPLPSTPAAEAPAPERRVVIQSEPEPPPSRVDPPIAAPVVAPPEPAPRPSLATNVNVGILAAVIAAWLAAYLLWRVTRQRAALRATDGKADAAQPAQFRLDIPKGSAEVIAREGDARAARFATPAEILAAESALKLLIAKAYLELGMQPAARVLLIEVEAEGSASAAAEARRLLVPLDT